MLCVINRQVNATSTCTRQIPDFGINTVFNVLSAVLSLSRILMLLEQTPIDTSTRIVFGATTCQGSCTFGGDVGMSMERVTCERIVHRQPERPLI